MKTISVLSFTIEEWKSWCLLAIFLLMCFILSDIHTFVEEDIYMYIFKKNVISFCSLAARKMRFFFVCFFKLAIEKSALKQVFSLFFK